MDEDRLNEGKWSIKEWGEMKERSPGDVLDGICIDLQFAWLPELGYFLFT